MHSSPTCIQGSPVTSAQQSYMYTGQSCYQCTAVLHVYRAALLPVYSSPTCIQGSPVTSVQQSYMYSGQSCYQCTAVLHVFRAPLLPVHSSPTCIWAALLPVYSSPTCIQGSPVTSVICIAELNRGSDNAASTPTPKDHKQVLLDLIQVITLGHQHVLTDPTMLRLLHKDCGRLLEKQREVVAPQKMAAHTVYTCTKKQPPRKSQLWLWEQCLQVRVKCCEGFHRELKHQNDLH